MNDYVDVTYKEKPFTEYPRNLVSLIDGIFDMQDGELLLDVGCGRGEYLLAFRQIGIDAYGNDKSESAVRNFPGLENYHMQFDLMDRWMVPERQYDYVFCKSVIEHVADPELLMESLWQWCKPGGRAIVMTPDFRSAGTKFWYDYDHKTPFVLQSLGDIFEVAGFEQVAVSRLYQVPIIWRWPFMKYALVPLSRVLPPFCRTLAFSRGPMLIGTGVKNKILPQNNSD